MAFVTQFGKRKLYLINYSGSIESNLRHLSKFIVQQIVHEFHDAAYNDQVIGVLYNFDCEPFVKSQLTHQGECYFELLAPAEAISHVAPDGQVFVRPGHDVKILSLKTPQKHYRYDTGAGIFVEHERDTMRLPNQKIYNYDPHKWPLFAERKHVFPVKTLAVLDESGRVSA